jgi:hypothetical protein
MAQPVPKKQDTDTTHRAAGNEVRAVVRPGSGSGEPGIAPARSGQVVLLVSGNGQISPRAANAIVQNGRPC